MWFGLRFGRKDPWPLRFKRHSIGVRCYNTLSCRVIYDNYHHTRLHDGQPTGVPARPNWQDDWFAHYSAHNDRKFAPPVQAWWTALDGSQHHATIDLARLFKDGLVRHRVPREDIPEGWLAAKAINPVPVAILVEVNDRRLAVYTRAHVATQSLRVPGNEWSNYRNDLILVWQQTY